MFAHFVSILHFFFLFKTNKSFVSMTERKGFKNNLLGTEISISKCRSFVFVEEIFLATTKT